MKSIYRILGVCVLFGCFTKPASAALLLSDFSDIATQGFSPFNGTWGTPVDQFVQNSGNVSITSVSGGDPTGDGSMDASIAGVAPFDFTAYNTLSVTASKTALNESSTFSVSVFDSTFTKIGSATFIATNFTTSFSTQDAVFTINGAGEITDATYWSLTGDGISTNSFRFSFDNLSATTTVPEPSTYALMAVGLGVLLVVSRRKKVAVRA